MDAGDRHPLRGPREPARCGLELKVKRTFRGEVAQETPGIASRRGQARLRAPGEKGFRSWAVKECVSLCSEVRNSPGVTSLLSDGDVIPTP